MKLIARYLLSFLVLTLTSCFLNAAPSDLPPHQATGVKVGEITPDSAIVWMRLTASPTRNRSGQVVKKRTGKTLMSIPADTTQLEGACPGAPGEVRLIYGTRADLAGAPSTDWIKVSAATDFTHHFHLTGLQPATVYYYAAQTTGPNGQPRHGDLHGQFATAPDSKTPATVTFCVVTGQMYVDVDDPAGYNIYSAMGRLQPQFIVFTGDNVYYDNEEPRARSVALARYHWERIFSLPRHVELLSHVGTYWEKDDHDVLQDDCWPALKSKIMGEFTFADGQRIFAEQTPVGDKPYRTFRWGQLLQVWLTEGRDFRSPNTRKDGPDKTIWGAAQKAWLKQSLLASDATWKVLVSPTPIVGPDRSRKNDNHANAGFAHEGNEIRQWFHDKLPSHFFIACGDRHWQYHSVHPGTGVQEFSCGPASDQHAGGSPGFDAQYHRFHRVKGGFLSVTVSPLGQRSTITFRFHDVNGKVVYEWSPKP